MSTLSFRPRFRGWHRRASTYLDCWPSHSMASGEWRSPRLPQQQNHPPSTVPLTTCNEESTWLGWGDLHHWPSPSSPPPPLIPPFSSFTPLPSLSFSFFLLFPPHLFSSPFLPGADQPSVVLNQHGHNERGCHVPPQVNKSLLAAPVAPGGPSSSVGLLVL